MKGERENIVDENEYGTLIMRSYTIDGNDVDAFYDANDKLIFVLDKTINENKPNILLVINPNADKKWDEILSSEYGVDLETIRPKQDNKYQKLDIEYSGLDIYENLINTYVSGGDVDEDLNQLNILRNSAVRHSAMMRLNTANEVITRTKVTIVKTKESIVRLQERLKTLRSKLSDAKKEIGRVSTKKSAAKILRMESQIESTNEKLKRAKKRLESAQKRLEVAMVDANLASQLLNQPEQPVNKPAVTNRPLVVQPKYEEETVDAESDYDIDDEDVSNDKTSEDDEEFENNSDIKPLLDKDPEIIDEDIAFKPISFDTQNLTVPEPVQEPEFDEPVIEDAPEQTVDIPENNFSANEEIQSEMEPEPVKPVLDSMMPMLDDIDSIEHEKFESNTNTDTTDNLDNVPNENTEFSAPDMTEHFDTEIEEPETSVKPIEDMVRPLPPVVKPAETRPVSPISSAAKPYKASSDGSKPAFVYYVLLFVLILASVFALWLYQKNMGNKKPILSVVETEQVETKTEQQQVTDTVVKQPEFNDDDFYNTQPVVEKKPEVVPAKPKQPVVQQQEEKTEPVIMGNVSARISAFAGLSDTDEEKKEETQKVEPVVNKPAYGTTSKYDEMFVYEGDEEPEPEYIEEVVEGPAMVIYQEPEPQVIQSNEIIYEADNEVYEEYPEEDNDGFLYEEGFDEEEAAYQAGDDGYDEYHDEYYDEY